MEFPDILLSFFCLLRLDSFEVDFSKMSDERDLKHDIEPARHDVDIGQMLAVEATPEEERAVLRKLDC